MCGRFILKGSWADTYQYYDLLNPADMGRNVPPRYNIAPTQDVLFVHHEDGQTKLNEGRWWLVPHWAKEIPKYTLFNARSEDAHKKPSFRDAYKWGRCLIPADGYYEWTKGEDGGQRPPLHHPAQVGAFCLCGFVGTKPAVGPYQLHHFDGTRCSGD